MEIQQNLKRGPVSSHGTAKGSASGKLPNPKLPTPATDLDLEEKKETRLTKNQKTPAQDSKETSQSSLGSTRSLSSSEERELQAKDKKLVLTQRGDSMPQVLGDCRLVKELGKGAMGAVYLAKQISNDNRLVALKVLFRHVAENKKLVDRLEREAKAMFDLDHRNIVQSYGWGENQGWYFVVLEYIDGESLQKWIDRLGKLPLGDALQITLICAQALEHAHSKNLIHRDIKPDNILINRRGEVKITDLGMVKKVDEEEDNHLTKTGHAVGTPWYMPLEQASMAKDADCRCDIYALGCMFYCMLTGNPPFTGQTIYEVIKAKERGSFKPARASNPEVTERVDLLIAKMTDKDPKHRYQNCTELIKDLENTIQDLGLTRTKLEFLFQQPVSDKTPSGVPSSSIVSTLAASLPVQEKPADEWYLRLTNAAGKSLDKKLTTAELAKMVTEGKINPKVEISRNPKDGFRALATYKEFQSVALGRVSKKAADKQTSQIRNLYKKIEAKEMQREEKDAGSETNDNFEYWSNLIFLWGLAAIAVGSLGFGIIYLLRQFLKVF